MKTVGTMLRETRIARGIPLETVEKATRIRIRFLSAIETDHYENLPSILYAKGFIKNYSEFLGMDSNRVLAFFRRQTHEIPRSMLLPKGVNEHLRPSPFQLTPAKFLWFIIGVCVLLFFLYFGVQYKKLQLPPTLIVESPKNESVATDRRIEVVGKTDPDATVMINSVSIIVRSDGSFFDYVVLESGVNTITVASTSRYGKTATVTRKVGFKQ